MFVPLPNLLNRYRKEGIGLVLIDPDHDEAEWALQPRNVRYPRLAFQGCRYQREAS
jgi:hypothetical protein